MGTAALMLLSAGGVAGAAPAVKPDPNAAPPKVHGPEKTTFAAAAGARPYWLDTRMDDGGTCRYGVGGGQPVICELVAQ